MLVDWTVSPLMLASTISATHFCFLHGMVLLDPEPPPLLDDTNFLSSTKKTGLAGRRFEASTEKLDPRDKSVISSREDELARHTWPHVARSSRRDSGDEKNFIELEPDLGVSLGQNIKHLSQSER